MPYLILLLLYCRLPPRLVFLIPHVFNPLIFLLTHPIHPLLFSTSSSCMRLCLSVSFLCFITSKNTHLLSTAIIFYLLSAPIASIISPSYTTYSTPLLHHPLCVLHIRHIFTHHCQLLHPPYIFSPCTTLSFIPVISSLIITHMFYYYRVGMPQPSSEIPPPCSARQEIFSATISLRNSLHPNTSGEGRNIFLNLHSYPCSAWDITPHVCS